MSKRPRLAAVSVDLDEIECYAAIHGLETDSRERADSAHAIYDSALPRLERLFGELQVPATFFAIGRDLARAENAAALKRAVALGHEVANHSMNHRYDLSLLPPELQASEVREGADAIERATGERPRGFRAPGYTIGDGLFRTLESQGYAYDSSVFPCPAYAGAKAAAIGAIRLRGRRSHSVVDTPRMLSAPADPYRVGTPYYRRGAGMLELPVGVTRGLRLPYIGTSVVLAGMAGARLLTRQMVGRPLVSLELHGIDLADARQDGLLWLSPYQPDLRRTADEKEACLRAAIAELRAAGYQLVPCLTAARHFASA